MDDSLDPREAAPSPAPKRPDLEDWRGDIRERPPAWRRRPRSEKVRDLWQAARPLIARIGEGRSWT